MDLTFLSNYYNPVVLVACLVVGFCIKHVSWMIKVANEYIPTILAVVGAVLAVVAAVTVHAPVTLETVVYGAFTGLASTGLHQAFYQLICKNK
ncbi:MAG: phage holin family protein [Lachnospiraceae bacterium]|nr:phage holin family protein [Lachnospiraceae bacterium]